MPQTSQQHHHHHHEQEQEQKEEQKEELVQQKSNTIYLNKLNLLEVPTMIDPIPPITFEPTTGNKIIEINLSENRLKRIDLQQLTKQFPNVQKLALGNNEIMGDFGEGISNSNWSKELLWLDLTFNHISSLNEEFSKLDKLASLGASECRLREIPEWMGNMKGMRKLGLFNNLITKVPPSLGRLSNLTKLDLSGNKLRTLPKEIGNLKKLTWLNLSDNEIEELPKEIEKLTNLKELGLAHNKLKKLPYVGKMRSLHLLTAFSNDLQGDPLGDSGVMELSSSIERIDLSSNKITAIPPNLLECLPWLGLLNLRNNQISKFRITKKIQNPNLQVDVRDNRIHELPSLLWMGEVDLKYSNNPLLGRGWNNSADINDCYGTFTQLPIQQPTPSLHLMALQAITAKTKHKNHYKEARECHLCEEMYYHMGWEWREERQIVPKKMTDSTSSVDIESIPFFMEICGAKCYNRLCKEYNEIGNS